MRNSDLPPVATVERMNGALRHRGPDDEGIAEFEIRNSKSEIQVVLGNTRLAIIDLSAAGHQPMPDSEAGLTITYNGEIYNFRQLRAEIGDAFGPWKSDTDTEVVLRAYRKWGVDAFAKLRGMFALGIWDARQEELVLARDRFGIKPLYYYGQDLQDGQDSRLSSQDVRTTGNSVIFASEVRALLASGLVERKLSRAGIASYLAYGSIQAPATIIDGVQSLLPGHYLRVRPDDSGLGVSDCVFGDLNCSEELTAETQRTQRLRREEEVHATGLVTEGNGQFQPRTRDEAVAGLRKRLTESVRLHLVSDVPLGVFLSGGMDSSALVALMSQVTKEKPKTFSVVFDEAQFSEAPHSRLVAEQFQTDHHEIHLTEDQLLGMLPAALSAMDQPTMDGVNTFVVSDAVKESGITVALSGLGGDELFAGYATFRRALRLKQMSGISRSLLRAAAPIGKTQLNGSVRRQKFWQLAESDYSPASVYAITRQLFAHQQVELLQSSSPQRHKGHKGGSEEKVAVGPEVSESSDCVNTISMLEMQGYMANTLLRDTDFMSMAHSLEVRVPFVDSEVVNYVLGLPGEWKLNGTRPKPLLADVFSDLLPPKFLERSKMGFTLPFEKWMRLGMRDEISNTFQDQGQLTRSGLDYEGVARVWEGFQRSPAGIGWSRPWSLYVLAKWCQLNGVAI
jgi:asparagine synthase (glutamine-hydrolysing)